MSDIGGFFDEESGDEERGRTISKIKKTKKRRNESADGANPKKSKSLSLIDDAAEESGEEAGNGDEEEDDEGENDYIKDGFVVDEDEDEIKKQKDDLEDSEDDDDEDDEPKRLKKSRVRKLRQDDVLDEEDLALISEARGDEERVAARAREIAQASARKRETVVAQNEAELRKGLFYESEGDDIPAIIVPKKPSAVERYDEDGMDDFIDDDIGDQGDILASDRRGAYDEEREGGVSEAQLNEASAIFGTDYLQFMAGGDEREDEDDDELLGRAKYRERGVGVDLGVDSEEDVVTDEDDDDLFGEDEGGEGMTAQQKIEALRLKREKRELLKTERRKQTIAKNSEKRKAQLRRAFEPVQLVENFCTERDDEIRRADIPERFFDWTTPFHGDDQGEITEEEQEEAMWIMGRIPEIASEFFSFVSTEADAMEKHQNSILESIVLALRLMHCEKLEPPFVKRYRADIVTSPAVRETLYNIQDEDAEWERMKAARTKVESLLKDVTSQGISSAQLSADDENLRKLRDDLQAAHAKVEETAKQEVDLKQELADLGDDGLNDDDDDELFGDNDEDEVGKAKKQQRERVQSHLGTIQSLLEERTAKVSQLLSQIQVAETRQTELLASKGPILQVAKKACYDSLWNSEDYFQYLASLTDTRHILDVNAYLNLIKEGNDAIRNKEMPALLDSNGKKSDTRKRSRRFDRDFYRTCVAEGLRSICYRFLLAPNRVGIKLEDTITDKFEFSKVLPGEENQSGAGDPLKWDSPTIPDRDPVIFANELVGSGELVMLSSTQGAEPNDQETKDPLRGCRYVAAIELAHEPRIRRHMRNIFRSHALLTTRPTKKGIENIDAFHDFYGLHLIKGKPVKEHFPLDEQESEARKSNLSPQERKELDTEMKEREKNGCLQYLSLVKAEQVGEITVHIHLPLLRHDEDWFNQETQGVLSRDNQDLSVFVRELEKVYLPQAGDANEWNDERRKVIRLCLLTFLLPQFESEIRRDLREAATKFGVQGAADNLRTMAMEGPYRPTALTSTENRFLHPTGDLPVLGVCCASDSKDASYLVSVTERGEVNDHLAIPPGIRVDSDKMREKVITFLLQARPAVILVGTSGGFDSRHMARKLGDFVTEAVLRWNNRDIQRDDEDDEEFEARRDAFRKSHPTFQLDDEELDWKCNVDLVDDSIAQLFGRSIRGRKEFPDASVNMKCAISVARHGKDPLAELAYAWSVASDAGVFGTEMLFLNVHPLQQLLPKTSLIRHYERVLCDVVSDVGVDVNTSCTFDHLHGLLSLVPGLGPRKAANIRQSVTRLGGAVASRRALLEKRLMGPCVYNNSVAFLRIREIEQLSNQFLHPLDDTRLHPDVYHRNNWAVKIAIDALERVDEDARNKESVAIKALRDVMDNSSQEVERLFKATKAEWLRHYGPTFNASDWDPRVSVPADQWRDKVEELDLETFAGMIEQNGLGRWYSHLQMIKWEFRLPFADPRSPMKPLDNEKLFRLITGETDQSLRPGKEVTGKIVSNGEFGSRVKVEGDIPAFIPLKNLADEHVEAAEDIVQVGNVVTAIVTDVKKDHISVDLSLKMEDFKKSPSSWDRPPSLQPLDRYFDKAAAVRLEQLKSKEREARLEALQLTFGATKIGGEGGHNDASTSKRGGRVSRRACAHPAFRNSRQDEVNRELREAGDSMVGEALVRPSSKNKDSLAIHWVVRPGCIKVIEVQEEGKDTDASIGNILKIKNETYGSIDELLGRYIAPMNDYVEELMNHRKFMDLPEDEVDEKLREEKKTSPSAVFYHLCWLEMHPGYASLRFMMSATPRNHHVGITPNGFTWGSKLYPNLDKLLNDFKKNPRGVATSSTHSAHTAKESSQPKSGEASKPSRWGAKNAAAPPAPPGWRSIPSALPTNGPVQNSWGIPASGQSGAAAPSGQWGATPSAPSVQAVTTPGGQWGPASSGPWGAAQNGLWGQGAAPSGSWGAAPSVQGGAAPNSQWNAPPTNQWGSAPSGQWAASSSGQWGAGAQEPLQHPPSLPPHPGHFQPPPPSGPPPPTFGQPPPLPQFVKPPPPPGPPGGYGKPPSGGFPFRPPPPPGAPPPNPQVNR